MKIALDRADSGIVWEWAQGIYAELKAGRDVGPAVRDGLIAAALVKCQPHVTAALRRVGIDLPTDEPLTLESIRNAINDKTGLDIADLSEDGVTAAIDAQLARRLSDKLGIEVTSVRDPDALREQVKAAAIDAIRSGRANALISRATINRVRVAATWARAGVPVDERAQYLARWYQKKYRRKHKQAWLTNERTRGN